MELEQRLDGSLGQGVVAGKSVVDEPGGVLLQACWVESRQGHSQGQMLVAVEAAARPRQGP